VNSTASPISTKSKSRRLGGTAFGSSGATAALSARFQVGGCSPLKFKPKLALKLKGSLRRTANPELIATLTAKPDEANIVRAQVKLPASAFLDNAGRTPGSRALPPPGQGKGWRLRLRPFFTGSGLHRRS
jgi:hypothetical protein